MNIKTLERAAKRQGLTVKAEYSPETQETVYVLRDKNGRYRGESNDKRLLCRYLQERGGEV